MTSAHRRLGRILLAEDHPVNQRVATVMLESMGFDVDVVANGADAVHAATRTTYRAILMDCAIPLLDGYQATAAIRNAAIGSAGAGGVRVPIIAVTASDQYSSRQRCLDAGMDDYLTKPLSLKALEATLGRWVPAAGAELDSRRQALAAGPPQQPARTEPAVLDAAIIDRLERLGIAAGEDLVGQLAVVFLADSEERVAALRAGLARGDCAVVRHAAHTLSGASASIGATDLAELCTTLATSAVAGDLMEGARMLESIEAELVRVADALPSRWVTS